jgi:hypothetical protein
VFLMQLQFRASSIVTTRSCGEMKLDSTLRQRRLTSAVPPLIRQFSAP